MAKFIFRLQTLLNLKVQLEKNLQNELGKEIQKLERERIILNEFYQEKQKYLDEFNKKMGNLIQIRSIRAFNEYLLILKKRIEFQKKTINKFENSVDIIRVRLIKVVQEKKMLEKLREKEMEKFTREELIKEQKINDEIASYKHIDKN